MTAAQALIRDFVHELRAASPSGSGLQFQCPVCSAALGSLCLNTGKTLGATNAGRPTSGFSDAGFPCPRCITSLRCEDGIWRALSPERMNYFASFVSDYEFIRTAEGRGSHASDYYLALPFRDLTGKNSAQWAIRARTFHYICRNILPALAAKHSRPLRILDLGAGNGWLSARLALLGHRPVAVDLLTNDRDGLAAAEHFRQLLPDLFPRVQAEHDHLPFTDAGFDLVIFNASFHYSEDYERTLREALRVGAQVLIADTPWYADNRSGEAMVAERRHQFALRFGIPSDSLASLEYLTSPRLHRLSTALNIIWHIEKPWYGLRWALRPLLAKLRRRRTPSHFFLYLAEPA